MGNNELGINYSNGIEKNIIFEMCTDALGQEFLIVHYSNYNGGYTRGFALGENDEEADFAFDITNRFSKDFLKSNMLFKNIITGIVSMNQFILLFTWELKLVLQKNLIKL